MLLRVGKALAAGILLLVGVWLAVHLVDRWFFMPELDTSLLTDDPCAAPCWQSIIPGVTTEGEARRLLKDSPFVRKDSLDYHIAEWKVVRGEYDWFSWRGRSREYYNYLYIRIEGKVELIRIHPDYTLTLGQVIDKFGPPERVYVGLGGGGNVLIAYLDYPAQGLRFTAHWSPRDYTERSIVDSGTAPLTEDWEIGDVAYFSPGPLEDVLQNPYLNVPDEVEVYLERAQEWKGFGRIPWYWWP
jgi:hypothetical protein